jgi:porin
MKKSIPLVALLSFICWVPYNLYAQPDSIKKQSPFSLRVSYVGNSVTNLKGGIKPGTVYLGMANLRASFNTASAGFWSGGELFINVANTHGGMPSAILVGDFQGVSNIEAGDLTYLYELWFKQLIGPICVIAGLQDMNAEFAVSESSGIFLNGSFGVPSTIAHDVPAPIFPLTALGIHLKWDIQENISVKIAVFNGLPDDFESNPYNFQWNIKPDDGFLTISEVSYHRNRINGLDGTYKLGGYYHSHVCNTNDKRNDCATPNYGIYFISDQVLLKRSSQRQLSLFTQVSLSPKQTNDNCFYFGLGLNFTGLFSKRTGDVLGMAVAHAGFNNTIRGNETTLEVTYQLKMNEHFFIQPDFQYIINPSGTDNKIANALVLTMRAGINF